MTPAHLLEERIPCTLVPESAFGPGPIEVEIGCGNGHFLCEYAADRPETTLVGIDIKKKRCLKAKEKAERRGYGNIVIINANAEKILSELARESVNAFHIYFPDPWPKSRHRKRRFYTMQNLHRMYKLLRRGGRIHFGTDFFDYYIQAKVLTALHTGLTLVEEPAPEAILSSLYGRKFSDLSKRILVFSAIKASSADEKRQQYEHEWNVDDAVENDEQG